MADNSETAGEGWEKDSIAVALVHEALQVLRTRGQDEAALLAAAGIAPALLAAPQARVPAAQYARLWFVTAQAMDDEFFGMDSHPMRVGAFAQLCHAVLDCRTLEQALRRTLEFLRLVLDDLWGELIVADERAHIVLHDRAGPNRMFAYCTWLIIVHGLACWLVGRRLPIEQAAFRCTEPADSADYRVRFCETQSFDRPQTIVTLPAELLSLKVIRNQRSLRDFLRGAPANLLVRYRNEASLAARIRQLLRARDAGHWPDLAALARELHLTESTLRRRLDEEGQSYQAIKDMLRRDWAIHALAEGDETVLELAAWLGFADASAFHRAFKKWTGASPGEYRRRHQATGPQAEPPSAD